MPKNKNGKLQPENFELETNTVWSFKERGDWATHDAKYRGNWSPFIPRNIILRYSKESDLILDPFVGSGTTLVEAKLLNRNAVGIDINPQALSIAKEHLQFNCDNSGKTWLYQGDAKDLKKIPDESIDLIAAHPPYANIIQYSEGIEGDLSHLKVPDFIKEMGKVANACYRVLKKGKFCAILMGDTRQKGCVIPLGFQVMQQFQNAGFTLKEIIIKEQHNCKATGYWKTNSIKYNFLLLAHEYLFVFRKG
jgi:DNA modification methylase